MRHLPTLAAAALWLSSCGGGDAAPPPLGSVRVALIANWQQGPADCGGFDHAYDFQISVDGAPLPALHACEEGSVVVAGLAPGSHEVRCGLVFLGLASDVHAQATAAVLSGQEAGVSCAFAPAPMRTEVRWTLNGGASACPAGATVGLVVHGARDLALPAVPCADGVAATAIPEFYAPTFSLRFVDPAYPALPVETAAGSPSYNTDPRLLDLDLVVPWL